MVECLQTSNGGYSEKTVEIMQTFTGEKEWVKAVKKMKIPEETWKMLVRMCKDGDDWRYDDTKTKTITKKDIQSLQNVKGGFDKAVIERMQVVTGQSKWMQALIGMKFNPLEWEELVDSLVDRAWYGFTKDGKRDASETPEVKLKLTEKEYHFICDVIYKHKQFMKLLQEKGV